jgi:hypothetical protein
MRLTLRTLLAYIDRVLMPGDHAELHRRIQQNEVIERLRGRIERLTNRPEMLTPRLQAPGLAGDPNAIAEYLDDVLPGASVPELERICLESDEYLAELADCHRLLATAIRTPVAVPDALRDRAIALIDPARRPAIEENLLTRTTKRKRTGLQVVPVLIEDAEADQHLEEPQSDAAAPVPAPMLASGGGSIRPEGLDLEDTKLTREVPEYLLGGTSRVAWRMPLAIAGVAVILAIMIGQALGPWDNVRQLLVAERPKKDLFANDPPLRVREFQQAEPDDSMFHELVISQEAPPAPVSVPAEAGAVNAGPTEGNAASPLAGTGNPLEVEELIVEEDAGPPLPSGELASSEDSREADIDTSDAAPPLPPGVREIGNVPSPPPSDLPAAAGQVAVWTPNDEAQRRTVLLLQTAEELRVARPNEAIMADRIIVPPYSRTQLTLAGGVRWVACGPSYLRVTEEGGQPTVKSELLRAFVSFPQQVSLRLSTPAGDIRILPTSPDAELAIEVAFRPTVPGSAADPDVMRAVLLATVTAGTATVEKRMPGATAEANRLRVGETFGISAGGASTRFMLRAIPEWFRTSTTRSSDKLALQDITKSLASVAESQEPARAALIALVESRRAENAALAVQISTMVGTWEPFASFLFDDRYRSYWVTAIELARQVIMTDTQQREGLRQALIEQHGPEHGELAYQFLLGLPGDVLESESVGPLVAQLESANLAVRVLAAYQLEKLTGQTFAYQPHAPNKSSIQQWRRELAAKRLSLLPIADIYLERLATAAP